MKQTQEQKDTSQEINLMLAKILLFNLRIWKMKILRLDTKIQKVKVKFKQMIMDMMMVKKDTVVSKVMITQQTAQMVIKNIQKDTKTHLTVK